MKIFLLSVLKQNVNYPPPNTHGWKQIGWKRDRKEIEKHISLSCYHSIDYYEKLGVEEYVDKIKVLNNRRRELNILGSFIVWFSLNCYPIANIFNYWVLRK